MAEFITKEYKKKDKNSGETLIVKTEYRIDADFEPKNAVEICSEFMENYCIAKGKKDLEWYLGVIETKKKVAKDNEIIERDITTLEIKKLFIERYFPNIVKVKKTNTRKETINRLREILKTL